MNKIKILLDLKNYKKCNQIGEGETSKVYLTKELKTETIYAAKVFDFDFKKDQINIESEINTILGIKFPSIIQYNYFCYSDFEGKQHPVLLMPYHPPGTLSETLSKERKGENASEWDPTKKLINIYGISAAILHMHKHGIVHGNINPRNVLETQHFHPKLSDFGILNIFNDQNPPNSSYKTFFTSPEVLRGNKPTILSDVYSFGKTVYSIMSGYEPYVAEIGQTNIESLAARYKKLIEDCVSENPTSRPTFEEILRQLGEDKGFIIEGVDWKEYLKYIKSIQSPDEAEIKNERIKNPFLIDDVTNIYLRRYERQEKIGQSPYSNIYTVLDKETGKICAARVMREEFYYQSNKNKYTIDQLKLMNEMQILSNAKFPSILKVFGYSPIDFKGDFRPVVVTEYLSIGSLEDFLHYERAGYKIKEWNDTTRLICICGIASAIKYLHSKDILHRDIKPDHVLLDEYLLPKLCGFYFSKSLRSDDKQQQNDKYFVVGTTSFIAPEIFNNKEYSKASDVYAFAMLVYEIMTKTFPFGEFTEFQIQFKVGSEGERPEITNPIPNSYRELIESCWNQDPTERPTFDSIVKQLKSEAFVTENIDEKLYRSYIEMIEEQERNTIDNQIFRACSIDSIYEKEVEQLNFLDTKQLDLSKFEKITKISDGNKKVYKIKDKITNETLVAKIPKKSYKFRNFKQELTILSKLKHPAIINLKGYSLNNFKGKKSQIIIINYAKNGSLRKLFDTERKGETIGLWDNTLRLISIYGIASAMSYLHHHDILHLNIKLENVLLDDFLFPVLTGFELSKSLFKLRNDVNSQIFGSSLFIAPEILTKHQYTTKADVYSFAYFVYEVMTKTFPFPDLNEFQIHNNVGVNGERPEISDQVPSAYKKLIELCWNKDPNERPTFDSIIEKLESKEFITEGVDEEYYREYIKMIKEQTNGNNNQTHIFKSYSLDIKYQNYDYFLKEEEELVSFKKYQVDLQKFEKIKKIGNGSFAKVYKIKEKSTDNFYSAKIFDSSTNFKNFKHELTILSKLHYPSILELFGYSLKNFKNKRQKIIIANFIKNGTLEDLLRIERQRKSLFFWNDTLRLINIYGIASAISYLHQQGILHLDIKPENVLLNDFLFPILIDFGLSLQNDEIKNINKIFGTASFIAPEILKENMYTEKADVYAFANLVYEIIAKSYPFEGYNEFLIQYKVGCQNERPKLNQQIPRAYRELIELCWDQDPTRRPTFEEIIERLESEDFITENVDEKMYRDYINMIKSLRQANGIYDLSTQIQNIKAYSLDSIYEELQNEN